MCSENVDGKFCRHQAYLRWQMRQQLLFAVANFEG